MLSVDTGTLTELLSEASKGRFGISKANEIQESASNTFGVNLLKMPLHFKLNRLLLKLTLSKINLKN
jgi:hypothetical protein